MAERSFEDYVKAANRPLDDPEKNVTVGEGNPRFELYHFPLSVCSQKVRTCLAEKRAVYVSHDINIQPGNYHPDYIRLRLLGRGGRALVGGYTGRSSVATEGFDPAVVPTLVDLQAHKVIADSVEICKHVDRVCDTGTALLPEGMVRQIEAEVAIVDATPHVAVLYGAHPDGDFRPKRLRGAMTGVHDRKIAKLQAIRDQVTSDAELVAALDAKIRKETAARAFVGTPGEMRAAVQEILGIVGDLNDRLSDGRAWACGDAFTMADVMWAVSLFRLKWLGMGFCWDGQHTLNDEPQLRVAAYAKRLFDRPSFQAAVIHWPGIPRSEYVREYYGG